MRARRGQAIAVGQPEDRPRRRRRPSPPRRRSSPSRRRRRPSPRPWTRATLRTMLTPFSTVCRSEPVAGAAEADQPAEDDVVGERERRREHADVPVGAGRRLDRLAAADQVERDGDDQRSVRRRTHEADGECRGSGARASIAATSRRSSAPNGLGDEAGGAGAEEIEGGEDEVEDRARRSRRRRPAPDRRAGRRRRD